MDLAYDDIILDNGWNRNFKWFILLSVIFHAAVIVFCVVVLPGLSFRTHDMPVPYTVNLISLPPAPPPAPAAPASLPVDTKSKIPPVQEIPAPEPEPAELVPVGPIKPKEPEVEIKKKETLPPEPEVKKIEKPKPEVKPEEKPKPKPKPSADQQIRKALKDVKRQVEAENQDQKIDQTLANLAAKVGAGDGETSNSPGVRGSGPISEIDARIRDYYVIMHNIIKHNWNIPTESMVGGRTDLETIYIIRVAPSGEILKAWFEKKSGVENFDSSVEKAIEKSKLPPLPEIFGGRNIEVGFRFTPSGMKKQ